MDDRTILEEALRRATVRAVKGQLIDAIKSEFFDRQLEFFDDPAREKGALCTRRAGKTSMWVRYCTIVGQLVDRSLIRIWGITRLRAKQLLWEEFRLLFARHGLKPDADYTMNETELTIRFANGSEIRLLGGDKDKEVQKKRGDKTVLEIVLEAQLFASYLKTLAEDVVGPCLFDMKGTLCLEGTPGIVCAGYWYEVSGREDLAKRWISSGGKDGIGAGWSMHRWSVLDNPMVSQWAGRADWKTLAHQELQAHVRRRRWTADSPTYQREWLARWVNDLSAMFYAFDPIRNTFTPDRVQPWGPGWEHTLGWDLGSRDDMAIVVWGWHPARPELYEAFSWKKPGALSAEIVGIIQQLERVGVDGKHPFNIVSRFADTGGGGRMFVEEVTARYGMQFQPAKKTEKYEHVRLLNDDLRSGFVLLQPGSPYAEEIAHLPRDLDYAEDHPEALPREHPGSPNHCCDAGLYAYRGAWHYLHREEVAKPVRGTPAWFAAEAKRMEDAVIERVQHRMREMEEIEILDAEWSEL